MPAGSAAENGTVKGGGRLSLHLVSSNLQNNRRNGTSVRNGGRGPQDPVRNQQLPGQGPAARVRGTPAEPSGVAAGWPANPPETAEGLTTPFPWGTPRTIAPPTDAGTGASSWDLVIDEYIGMGRPTGTTNVPGNGLCSAWAALYSMGLTKGDCGKHVTTLFRASIAWLASLKHTKYETCFGSMTFGEWALTSVCTSGSEGGVLLSAIYF